MKSVLFPCERLIKMNNFYSLEITDDDEYPEVTLNVGLKALGFTDEMKSRPV
jgi:hypothetical protein